MGPTAPCPRPADCRPQKAEVDPSRSSPSGPLPPRPPADPWTDVCRLSTSRLRCHCHTWTVDSAACLLTCHCGSMSKQRRQPIP
eukprot:349929-Chlamydomonas_euryale.AAC.15